MALADHFRSLNEKPVTSTPSLSIAPKGVEPMIVRIAADDRTGRGFVVNGEGKITTDCQLVSGASKIKVTTSWGDVFLAKVLREDAGRDLALIQIPTRTPKYLDLGDPSAIDVGDDAYVLDRYSSNDLVKAVITGIRRINGVGIIQLDSVVEPGNSGGPVLTPEGNVLALTSFKFGQPDDVVGLSVTVNELKSLLFGDRPNSERDFQL